MTDWKLVPVEPTEEMLRLAVKRASMIGGVRVDWPTLRVTYKSMIAAAPSADLTELGAEVGRLNALIESGRRCNDEYAMQKITLNHRIEAAKAKLAAIEGVRRYDSKAGFSPRFDGDWIKAADILAILDPEAT